MGLQVCHVPARGVKQRELEDINICKYLRVGVVGPRVVPGCGDTVPAWLGGKRVHEEGGQVRPGLVPFSRCGAGRTSRS